MEKEKILQVERGKMFKNLLQPLSARNKHSTVIFWMYRNVLLFITHQSIFPHVTRMIFWLLIHCSQNKVKTPAGGFQGPAGSTPAFFPPDLFPASHPLPRALLAPYFRAYFRALNALCTLIPWTFTDVLPAAQNSLFPQPSHCIDWLTLPYPSGLSLEVKQRLQKASITKGIFISLSIPTAPYS